MIRRTHKPRSRTVRVDNLARVEGEGALYLKIKGDKVAEVKFKIFEPPRFFEAFLRGRRYQEAPDINARICGICPVAYQMSSVHAIEDALGIKVEGPLRELRRLIYCGEWIESQGMHVCLLHAPDFLGYQDAIEMARDHPEVVQRGLQLKKAGNEIVSLMGGREIHPINVCVGGFYRVPTKQELAPLAERLKWARDQAVNAVHWAAELPFPDFEQDYEFVSLRHEHEYPFNEGRIVSTKGLDIAVREYDKHFAEEHVEHSNALHSVLKERGAYCVGPLARFNLCFDTLSPLAQATAQEVGFVPVCNNPFKSIIARSIDILYAFDEALRLIEEYEMPDQPFVKTVPRAATGFGFTEAPRGSLYHRYTIDEQGLIVDAKIVAPTSQNQKIIESDLGKVAAKYVDLPKEKLTWQCEQAVRNYDPCISCATHFLKLKIERE